jgi:phospholipase C
MRRLGLTLRAAGAALCAAPALSAAALPPIHHVWVVVLENKGYDTTFGPSTQAPYLARTLPAQGQLLTQYYGIGHASLDNYIALVSGQAPNVETQSDCQLYTDVLPGVVGPHGQAIGQGCVYPTAVPTIADQLQGKGLSWRGYLQDMGTACRHPATNSRDTTQSASSAAGGEYAARHNPFVYFHSITDTPSCAADDVDLSHLQGDLDTGTAAPAFSLIVPDLCEDGHDTPCADNRPGGLVSADAFLQTWVPKILASPAYADNGLVIVTFDESDTSDASACCGEPMGYNTINPGATTIGPGGGRVGAVLLSPFIVPGTVNATPYNHYALLRSVEDLFGLGHLGYAGASGLQAFGTDVFGG